MENKTPDVIVIGSGIIGLSCAYYLAEEGKTVTVLEKGEPKDASSHANCGLVAPSHAMPLNSPALLWKALKWLPKKDSPFYIKPQLNVAFWYWLISFALNSRSKITAHNKIGKNNLLMSSKSLFEALIQEHSINCNWSNNGVLFVFLTQKAFDAHGLLNDKLTSFNAALKATPFIGERLREKEPAISENVYGGWLYPIDASLKPDEFIKELKNILIAKGVKIITKTEVVEFESTANEITGLKTNSGNYSAKQYVLATGAWTKNLANQIGVNIPIYPGKGYSITMKKPSIVPKTAIMLVESKVVATPFNNSYRLGGTMEFSGFNNSINRKRIGALKKAAELYLKEPYTDDIEEEWFGWRPMTNNDMPIIDFAPNFKNLLVAAGHNMVGVSMATGTGKLVSELLLGKEPHIDPSFYKLKAT